MTAAFRIVARGRGYSLATWNDHVLSHWYGPISAEGLQALEPLVRVSARKHPSRKCGDVILLDPQLALPDELARSAVMKAGRTIDGMVHGVAVVVQGDGFFASAMRALATSVGMVTRVGYPIKSFASAADAGRFMGALVEKAGDAWGSPSDLDAALVALRAVAP